MVVLGNRRMQLEEKERKKKKIKEVRLILIEVGEWEMKLFLQ